MHNFKALHIAIEGIDGCGKGTAVEALMRWATENRLSICELEHFAKRHHRLPRSDEVPEDVIVAQEPTFATVGKAIRETLTRNGNYSAQTLAHAFSLDREMYYREVVIPSKDANKFIFQERSVMSSIVYQGAMEKEMTEKTLSLEGNRLALAHIPDLIIVVDCDVEIALQRILQRAKESHRSISRFENAEFLMRVKDRFASSWLHELLVEHYGTKIVTIDNSHLDKEEFIHQIIKIVSSLNLY